MKTISVLLSVCILLTSLASFPASELTVQPAQPVKLIFIHHSTGENWLTDGYGNLGRTLGQNNYFVSDTNYGWGPDAIGDRTDIPNWIEWFRSDQTGRYMQALFNESEQHASYTRTLKDPGGENQIILFKSCFPNSDLEGNPNDPPGTEAELSVGGAKYVYNEILKYFATRPDKMFVLFTSPPLSDGTHAANARALTQWLLNDWLRSNNYKGNNVFVYDFYNVLTSRNAHHRVTNGQIEYILGERNTLAYPSGDDHPSEEGSRKATSEFVPVLNLFYQRWKASNPPGAVPTAAQPAATATSGKPAPTAAPATPRPAATQPAGAPGRIDDFEGAAPDGSAGWEAFRDESASTTLACAPARGQAKSGAQALQINFNVAAGSWATCALYFDPPKNWESAGGVAFEIFANAASFEISLQVGPENARATYLHRIQISSASAPRWSSYQLGWDQFLRADWEENAGTALARPDWVGGITFGFNAPAGAANAGTIWVDDLRLTGAGPSRPAATQPAAAQPTQSAAQPAQPAAAQPTQPPAPTSSPGLPVCGSALVPLALVAAAWRRQGKR